MQASNRRLHKIACEELHNLYSSPNTVRVMKTRRVRGRICTTHGRDKYFVQSFGRKRPEGKRQLGSPRSRREDNTKTDLKEI
jgi:hypothetical protein